MSLGLILGGVAKGYQQGEEIQNERARRKALEQKTAIEAGDEERKRAGEAARAAIPAPGAMVPVNYDPELAVEDAVKKPQAPPPAHRAGIIGALGRFLSPQSAALAAGVTPAPAPSPAVAAPAGAEPPMPEGSVEGVTATAPRQGAKRPVSELDVARMRWAVAKKTGTAQDEMAAGEGYFNAVRDTTGKAILGATDAQLGNIMSDALGKTVEIVPKVDKAGKPAGYGFEVDGQEIAQAADRSHLNAELLQRIERNPSDAFKMAHDVRVEDLEHLKAQSEMEARRKTSTAALMEGKAALSNAGTNAARGRREQQLQDLSIEDRQHLTTAWEFMKDPDAALKDPAGYAASAAVIRHFDPHDETFTQVYDANSGTTVRTPVSASAFAGEAAVKAFMANPYVQAGVVQPAQAKDGTTAFAVMDPKTGQKIGFTSSAEAFAYARRHVAMPKAKK